MQVWKQWTDEHCTRKTGSGRRKVTSARDDRHLLHMAVNDRTVFSRKLAARWSTAAGVLMSASSIRRRLLHRALRSRDHEGRICLRRYTGERCLPECVIERHSGLTPRVMVWGTMSYHGQSNLLQIEGNLNCNRLRIGVLELPTYYIPRKLVSLFSAALYRRRPITAGNFDAQFLPQRKAPELWRCETVLMVLILRKHPSQIGTQGVFYMLYNHSTWPLLIFYIMKIHRLGPELIPQP
ncbi:transposable element Tc1 transposase [Trichonephila clavipes]|nr:transposable element Tc1 transposase [Trichonephila clavipes]